MGKLRYKGYTGSVEYSEEENSLFGKVLGLRRDGIVYEGSSAAEIRTDFEEAIDHYLESCAERGVEPEKPYSGNIILRMPPELHGQAAERADALGESMNDFINNAIRLALASA
ncbi:MAG: type II toxin-antitoxin system HicB family antitoxin [Bacteroidales bacterium]|nr:type II toxin-antitoxin system HicB family antitoxin [Bacteroidales bacterium]MBR0499436.1 type II toxin-antitoxin system HicB family antitoxin [Bacteroidales bacterium]